MNEKIPFHRISEILSEITGSSTATSELFIKELFAAVSDALVNGESVKVKGLGTFSTTGIKDRPILFAPDEDLAEAINTPFSCFEAIELNADVTDDELNSTPDDNPSKSSNNILECETSIIEDIELQKQGHNDDTGISGEEIIEPTNDNIDSEKSDDGDVIDEIFTSENTVAEESSNKIEEENDKYIEEPDKEPGGKKRWLLLFIGLLIGCAIGYFIGCNYPHEKVVISNMFIPDNADIERSDTADFPITDSLEMTDTLTKIIDYPPLATDTVGRTRFLTTMARKYYGEMLFWVYIYEANKEKLGNPNLVKPGTSVTIPDLRQYGVDGNDSANIEIAKLKAIEIYAPYQK